MLRITRVRPANANSDGPLLRLEGQVTGPWVEELRRVCNETISLNGHGSHPLVLDLTDVSFIDTGGVALFRELTSRRVSWTNCSMFVAEQLKEAAHAVD